MHNPEHGPSLTELANRFGSDKGTVSGINGPPNRYTRLYDMLFAPYRNRRINLLELGWAAGGGTLGSSVRMWLEYFKEAHIFGFDTTDLSEMPEPRLSFIRGDVGSEEDLRSVARAALSFDVIIDDASHASYHQQLAFKLLYPQLAPGGLYIIEDLHWQPDLESDLPPIPKTAEFLTEYLDRGRYLDNALLSAETMNEFKRHTASFSPFPAFDGTAGPTKLIVLRKSVIEPAQDEFAASGIRPTGSRSGSEAATAPDRFYLVSHHDTILYVDKNSQHLRHAPLGVAPLNLVLELVGTRGRLMTGASLSDARQVSFAQPTGEIRTQSGRGGLDWHIDTFGDDSIGIRGEVHYLRADHLGGVDSVDWCREWERYRLVRVDTIDGIALLRRHSWLSHSDRRIVSLAPQPFDFGRDRPAESSALAAILSPGALDCRRELVFGPARIRLAGKDRSFLMERSGHERVPPVRVHIVERSGVTQTFSRFAPLIYYCVYGDESFYQCLHTSLSSLAKYGCYSGTVGVASDRPAHELAKFIPEAFHHRLIVSDASRERGWFNQYYLEHRLYEEYQPILYCDADVIFDASITDLLIDALRAGRICCATEAHALPDLVDNPPRAWEDWRAGYFGRDLYASDPEFYDTTVCLGNAGVVGFDNTARVEPVNDLVRMIAARQSPEQLRMFTDQQILNYVLHKTGAGDFHSLDKYCRLARSLDEAPVAERRGMTHFHLASGTEDASPKTTVMQSYMEVLDRYLAQQDDDSGAGVELTTAIPGRMHIKELERLAILARRVPPNGCIVELGSLFGLSSWTLAKNAHPSVTVYCVDAWVREPWMLPDEEQAGQTVSVETFRKNVAGLGNIVPLQGYSPRDFVGWQRTIDLLFDDCVHTNPVLHQNLQFWTRFVRQGGVICGHDYSEEFPEVKAEADALAGRLGARVQVVETLWSMWIERKVAGEDSI
jgi:predicted O-methyltransferase YrrM